MFEKFYEPKPNVSKKEDLSVAEQGKRSAIEALQKGVEDASKPVTLRLIRVNALINLLQTYADDKENIRAKIDLVEAEHLRDELLKEASNAGDKKAA